jgi:hypothetical protein
VFLKIITTIILPSMLLASCTTFKGEYIPQIDAVQKIPKTQLSFIEFSTHISQWQRPKEHIHFPLLIGDIGPSQPLYAGTNTYPFKCETLEAGLGQPLIDNHEKFGVPVFDGEIGASTIIGYSQNCAVKTRVDYYFKPNTHPHAKYVPWQGKRNELTYVTINGELVPFVLRVERGVINRFPYLIAFVVPLNDKPEQTNTQYWNKRLILAMRGGVGIGRRQGALKVSRELSNVEDQLMQGYAVAYSEGLHTKNHYNALLAEDTARRLKLQVSSRYGKPLYTVGLGGSGGGLMQYLLAQNTNDILDAAIPQYSYPDMVSQTNYAMDCDLLEYYFDIQNSGSEFSEWDKRQALEGLHSAKDIPHKFEALSRLNLLRKGKWSGKPKGSSECINGWRALTPFVSNPSFMHFFDLYTPEVYQQTAWTYWDDLAQLFGVDEHGYALRTWSNVGVQYGLQALNAGELSPKEFLLLNSSIGGWKSTHDMQPEHIAFWMGDQSKPLWLSVWAEKNRYHPKGKTPAKRTDASELAIERAYRSGQVFIGKASIPIIDIRHYLEPQLNMHHLVASFQTRSRIIDYKGNADNQLIWVSHPDYDPTNDAFAAIDQWMLSNKGKAPIATLSDRCIDDKGQVIAQGKNVWNGWWNKQATGECLAVYPAYKNSRMAAGEPITADYFACELMPVEQALKQEVYAKSLNMQQYIDDLKRIFPDGVCDYSKAGRGKPRDL